MTERNNNLVSRLTKRVERMEGVIGNIVSKIDKVLIKLESMEKSKTKKKQNLGKLFDGLTNDEAGWYEKERNFVSNISIYHVKLSQLKLNFL